MAQGPSETGRSYVGLICLLVVIVALIGALSTMNIDPLSSDDHGGGHGTEADGHGDGHDDGHGDDHHGDDHSANDTNGSSLDVAEVKLPPAAPLPDPDEPLTEIAFGSCLGHYQPAPILNKIAARRPQLFVWMGDNVYGDGTDEAGNPLYGPDYLEAAYRTRDALPAYQQLYAAVPFLATWDDHDYGLNDAGAELTFKNRAKSLFLEYMGHNAHPNVNTRGGIYDAFTFGPEGKRTQIILLDTRSFRSPLKETDEKNAPGKERYVPDPDPSKTVLGDVQWLWLGEQLRKPADVRFIVSSIQVLADGHGWERWGNLPAERERLFALIKDTGAKGVIFLSGDRHAATIYKNEIAVDYPLYEITSSSLNLPLSGWGITEPRPETDDYKLDELFIHENFGIAQIDWEAQAVFLELRDKDGHLVQSASVRMDD